MEKTQDNFKSTKETRRRQIFNACSARKGAVPTKEAQDYYQIDFCAGAEWADRNPKEVFVPNYTTTPENVQYVIE